MSPRGDQWLRVRRGKNAYSYGHATFDPNHVFMFNQLNYEHGRQAVFDTYIKLNYEAGDQNPGDALRRALEHHKIIAPSATLSDQYAEEYEMIMKYNELIGWGL